MRIQALVVGAVLAAAVLAGCTVEKDVRKLSPGEIDIRPTLAARYAINKVSPAVVRLDVVTEAFRNGQPVTSRSIGSGVIIDSNGHVLTNFHVAGRAKRIDITLASQERVRATLVGSDHWTDLALVKLDMDDLKARNLTFDFAPMGKSDDVVLGQPVMALGTPHGLTRTLTAGIISNTDRFFDESTIDGYETGWFNNWFQMDAAINPGNSGGPLVNLRGEVIGINTRGGIGSNNLGFAIPIDVAKEVALELLKNKKVSRSYVGIQLQPMQDLERYYEGAGNKGVLIGSVEKDSPAAIAGLKAEDVLLAVDDAPVNARFPEQLAAVRKLIADKPIGSDINLTVARGAKGEKKTVTVKTERLESVITEEKSIAAWGLSVRALTRAYLREARLPQIQGVLVTGVRAGTAAETAQIQKDDIILRIDGKKIASVEELEDAVAKWAKSPKPVAIDIRRDRAEMIRSLKPRE